MQMVPEDLGTVILPLFLAPFLGLFVGLDRWGAVVKGVDEYEGGCWACGQRTQHKWGCPNR